METILGTTMPYTDDGAGAFSMILPLIAAAGGFTLSQVKAITGLEGSTIQNWVKRGWVSNPKGKKYDERQLPRILLISALRDGMQIEQIVRLIRYVNIAPDEGVYSESSLFDDLCAAVRRLDPESGISADSICAAVQAQVAQHSDLGGDDKRRLEAALHAMVLAWGAGQMRRRADILAQNILA